jgi:threonine synthase
MILYSTNNKNYTASFKEAVIMGIAKDGGLFMPASFPTLPDEFFKSIGSKSFQDISFNVAHSFIKDEVPEADLYAIINDAINFSAPIQEIKKNQFVLELFHGPTLAFKDFGARFMAKTLSYFLRNENKDVTILVATSGDTGSAVANGFFNVEGINVVLLYPSGKVSQIQEQQLTTLGGNITALEIDGTFDDCQKLVKQAFADNELNTKIHLSSANSINIARLIPQSFYYFNAYAQLQDKNLPVVFSVPSGNFGNLTGGLFAYKMGLPMHRFIAATNSNDVFPEYLRTGIYTPKPSVKTLSNAMDVGNPSNFARIADLFDNNCVEVRKVIFSNPYNDEQTKSAIKEVKTKNDYLFDPHGAVGYLALTDYLKENPGSFNSIILETAHPGKFADVLEDILKQKIDLPEKLQACMRKQKDSIKLSKSFDDFKAFLWTR